MPTTMGERIEQPDCFPWKKGIFRVFAPSPPPRNTNMKVAKPPLPSQDKRWKIVDARMRRYGYEPDALIEVLHQVQESFGYLDEVSLKFTAAALRLPLSKVYGVATFYNFFSIKPQGEHTCVVCMGTACYIKGAPQLLDAAQKAAGVKPGETSADGKVSLITARCFGSCGLAPAAIMDGEVRAKAEPAAITATIEQWRTA